MKRTSLDLRHLRYFVAVAEELHFGRAARRLGLAQPPLSQQIQRLEASLGFPLFERRPRVKLTPAGSALLGVARRALSQVAEALSFVDRVAHGKAGLLRLTFAASTLLTVLPDVIRTFRRRYPEVELRLQELSTTAQIAALVEGTSDVGVLREPPDHDELAYQTLAREPFVAVLPAKHPLAAQRKVSVKVLCGEPFVHFRRQVAPALYDQVAALCRSSRATLDVSQEALEWFTVVGLVESGMGVSIIPASFRGLRWRRVVYRPLSSAPVRTVTRIGWRRNASLPALANFLEIAGKLTAEFDDRGQSQGPAKV